MSPGVQSCSELGLHHCSPAWETDQDSVSTTKKKERESRGQQTKRRQKTPQAEATDDTSEPRTLCPKCCLHRMPAKFTDPRTGKTHNAGPVLHPGRCPHHDRQQCLLPVSLIPVTWLPLEASEVVASTRKVLSSQCFPFGKTFQSSV